MFLAAQIATPGCLFVAKDVEHREFVRDEPTQHTQTAGMIVFAGRSQGGHVQARAFVRQICTDGGLHVYNRTIQKHLSLEGLGGGGSSGEALVALLFLPVTLISLAASGAAVEKSEARHDVVRDYFARTRDCSHSLRGLRVIALLPSGQTAVALTDPNGIAWFDVPATEPPSGSVIVSLADHQVAPVTIPYGQTAIAIACAHGDCEALWNAQPAPRIDK